jgi:hypothetical protein
MLYGICYIVDDSHGWHGGQHQNVTNTNTKKSPPNRHRHQHQMSPPNRHQHQHQNVTSKSSQRELPRWIGGIKKFSPLVKTQVPCRRTTYRYTCTHTYTLIHTHTHAHTHTYNIHTRVPLTASAPCCCTCVMRQARPHCVSDGRSTGISARTG